MSSLRPPSTSPSPSPAPNGNRASMGPSARNAVVAPASPRPGGGSGARPTSELLGSAGMFQTPEAEAIDQWFENLHNYEATLEEMAAASLDVNFKEELSAIEQWFKVLSEAERTAALYSLLQHSTQVQIRFFITVLQQMARSDPMTALLSPAVGGSMQSQMEAKLASMNLKSPGLKSTLPSSPTMRNFSSPNAGNRSSVAVDTTSSNFLSPESAALASPNPEAAATLAQQRAKLKATNAAHRISAPVLSTGGDGRNGWPASPLSQLAEQNAPAQEIVVNPASRPKSTEFTSSPRPDALSPMVGESWASMVNTPLIPMFQKDTNRAAQNLDSAAGKLNDWSTGSTVPRMGDPKIFRRQSKTASATTADSGAVYGDDGNLVQAGTATNNTQQRRNVSGGLNANANPFGGNNNNNQGWNGARSPALSGNGRFDGGDGMGVPNGFGMGMGMASPGLGMPGLAGMAGMGQLSPFMMNMAAMGMTPEAMLAAQMAAAQGFGANGWMGMPGVGGMGGMNNRGQRGPGSTRSAVGKAASNNGRGDAGAGAKKDEEDVDPALLNDVPAWLRSLRLHKYTPNFEGMKWQEMVVLDEAALEQKGVAALGARRKMLKTFEVVRKKMGIEGGPPATTA